MKKLETLKAIVGFTVSVGAGVIVGNVVKLTTPSDAKAITKVLIKAGELGISGFIGEKAADYANDQIDAVAAIFTGVKAAADRVEEAIKLQEDEQTKPTNNAKN